MSELLEKQANVQNESLKIQLPGFMQAPANSRKVSDENEIKKERKKKKCLPIKILKDFIRPYQKTG